MAKSAFIISIIMVAFIIIVAGISYIGYPDYRNPASSWFIQTIHRELMFWIFYTAGTTVIILGIAGWIENKNNYTIIGIILVVAMFFAFPKVQTLSFAKYNVNPITFSSSSQKWAIRGYYDGAIRDFNSSINLDPDNSETYIYRAKVFNRVGLYDKAISDYNKAIQLNSDSSTAYRNRGYYFIGQNQNEQAIADLNKAIELDKKYATAYCDRGIAYLQQKKYDQSIQDFDQSILLDPLQTRAYYNLGILYRENNEMEKSKLNFNKASELDSKFALAFMQNSPGPETFYLDVYDLDNQIISDFNNNDLNNMYSENSYSGKIEHSLIGENNDSLIDLSKAIELNPDYAANYYYRSLYYVNDGLIELAIMDLSKAIDMDPDYFMAYNNRGLLLLNIGQYDQAFDDLNKAIELYPNLAISYYNRSLVFDQRGDVKSAISDLTQAIKLSESNYFTSTANRQLELITNTGTDHTTWLKARGDMLLRYKKYDRAIEYYGKAISNWPDNYYAAYLGRAVAYEKKGQFDLAIADLKKAIEIEPKNNNISSQRHFANFYLELGYIYSMIGENDLEILNLNKAIVFPLQV